MFNTEDDSNLFRTRRQIEERGYIHSEGGTAWRLADLDDYLRLYEGKLFHQFDHRFATFAGGAKDDKTRDSSLKDHTDPRREPEPRYWVLRAEAERALGDWPND